MTIGSWEPGKKWKNWGKWPVGFSKPEDEPVEEGPPKPPEKWDREDNKEERCKDYIL